MANLDELKVFIKRVEFFIFSPRIALKSFKF